jgi:hypothetical protein
MQSGAIKNYIREGLNNKEIWWILSNGLILYNYINETH